MAGQLTISGLAAGLASGSKIIGPNTATGGAIVAAIVDVPLVTGDNTVAVPNSAVFFALFIPTTNTSNLFIRTNLDNTDTGFPIAPAGPWMASSIASGVTSLIIHATAGGATVEFTFI